MNRLKRFLSVMLMAIAICGLSLQLTGCSSAVNSSEPDSGPPPDPAAGMDVELPH